MFRYSRAIRYPGTVCCSSAIVLVSLISLSMMLAACGGGGGGGNGNAGAPDTSSTIAVGSGLPSASRFIDVIEVEFGNEDAALNVLLKALDNGYSLSQIVDAVLGDETSLDSDGLISDNDGTVVAAKASKLPNTVTLVQAPSYFARLFTTGIDDLRIQLQAWSVELALLEYQAGEDFARTNGTGLLITLLELGYTPQQIEQAYLTGYHIGQVGLGDPLYISDSMHLRLFDEAGISVTPSNAEQCEFSEFFPMLVGRNCLTTDIAGGGSGNSSGDDSGNGSDKVPVDIPGLNIISYRNFNGSFGTDPAGSDIRLSGTASRPQVSWQGSVTAMLVRDSRGQILYGALARKDSYDEDIPFVAGSYVYGVRTGNVVQWVGPQPSPELMTAEFYVVQLVDERGVARLVFRLD